MAEYDIITFDKLYKDGKKLKLDVFQPFEYYQQIINNLKAEQRKADPDFDILKSGCDELVSSLMMPIWITPYEFVLRARPNFNKEIFERKTQISYNSETPHLCRKGRFNLDGESEFYCTLPYTPKDGDGSLGTIMESDKELFSHDIPRQEKYFTIGRWTASEPFRVLMLMDYSLALENSLTLKYIHPIYDNFINEVCSPEDKTKYSLVLGFFSEIAGRRNEHLKDYLLTTAFYHAIKDYYGTDIGILFSSSMTDNHTMNIVMPKEMVDKYFNLDLVVMFKAYKDIGNGIFQIGPCSDPSIPDRNGRFQINNIEYSPFKNFYNPPGAVIEGKITTTKNYDFNPKG